MQRKTETCPKSRIVLLCLTEGGELRGGGIKEEIMILWNSPVSIKEINRAICNSFFLVIARSTLASEPSVIVVLLHCYFMSLKKCFLNDRFNEVIFRSSPFNNESPCFQTLQFCPMQNLNIAPAYWWHDFNFIWQTIRSVLNLTLRIRILNFS